MKGNTNAVNGISKIMLHGQKLPITNQSVTIPDISKTAYGVAKAGEGIKVQNGVISSQSSIMNHVQLTCQEPAGDKLVLIDEHGGYKASGGVIGIPPFGYYIENPGAVTKRTIEVGFIYTTSSYGGHWMTIKYSAKNVLTGSSRELGQKEYTDLEGLTVEPYTYKDHDLQYDISAEETVVASEVSSSVAIIFRGSYCKLPITYLIPE